ncbi:unnamed protein product [Phytomonas sp. Hart1]|nr:unnamed protein product [Phytomonas sp. Hart1]|eukprot:CCW70486.1 unnamed protein product [Phytomonas sp. isolate Hart1]
MADAARVFLNFTQGWPRFGPGRAVRTARPKPTAASGVGKGEVPRTDEPPLGRRFPLLRVLPLSSVIAQGYEGEKGGPSTSLLALFLSCSAFMTFSIPLGASCDEAKTLRSMIWGGCRPEGLRPAAWRLLLGYTPPTLRRQPHELLRKRAIYEEYIHQYIQLSEVEAHIAQISARRGEGDLHDAAGEASTSGVFSFSLSTSGGGSSLIPHEKAILHQIARDLPRHRASVYHCGRTLAAMARSLFLWSQRHPAVGYVQGMDDLLGVFFQIFLADGLRQRAFEQDSSFPTAEAADEGILRDLTAPGIITGPTLQGWGVDRLNAALVDLPEADLLQIEADTYWCASRVLSLLQDNYVPGQKGLIKSATRLEGILATADPILFTFLSQSGVRLLDSCFQWIHCLLVRELPLPLLLRLWDTYFAVGDDHLLRFHLYICAALVMNLRSALLGSTMDQVMLIMKNPFDYAKFPAEGHPKRSIPPEEGGKAAMGFEEPPKEESLWLEILIAEAYRLWRQYPSL